MATEQNINIREASIQEDLTIAKHFYQLWIDNYVPTNSIKSDWLDITLQFISQARQELYYKAFVAEIDNVVIGSVSCQLFAGLYPQIQEDSYRKYGYIWNVYVEAPYRAKGVGKKLTNLAVNYLKSIKCTRVILHASPSGKPVYDSLGFSDSNEMRLDLS